MVGLGTRSAIERAEIGNSRPKAARASALPDGARNTCNTCRIRDGALGHERTSRVCYTDRIPIFLSRRRINTVAVYCIKYSPDPHPVIMVRRKGSAFGS